MIQKKLRIFMGLNEVAGYYTNLKKGFDELGIESIFIHVGDHPFKYSKDSYARFIKIIRWVDKNNHKYSKRYFFKKIFWKFLFRISRVILFLWAISKYNVFIFGHNSSFLSYRDLPILKFFRKKIIYVFHGSDSRPPYLDGLMMSSYGGLSIQDCILQTKEKKKVLYKIEKYANYIINSPPQAFLLERPFILWFSIGIPFECEFNGEHRFLSDKVTILHAPAREEDKGTAAIEEIIESLRKKGYDFNFIKLKNVENRIVLENLLKCDFIIDQLYSDTPMATFAAEAAFFGKPAIVGGYYADYILDDLTNQYIPPSNFCHPKMCESAIEKMITSREHRLELGRKAQEFVKNNWTPKNVAEKYLKIINNDIPDNWFYDPNKLNYFFGSYMHTKKTKRIISEIIKIDGISALCLKDKPDIERKVFEFLKDKDNV